VSTLDDLRRYLLAAQAQNKTTVVIDVAWALEATSIKPLPTARPTALTTGAVDGGGFREN